MHRLDEASIIDSMRRVYYRRICEVLGESETRDKRGNFVISPGLKVRHKKSQFEYTVIDVQEDPKSGKMVIILQSPEAPRFDSSGGEKFVGIPKIHTMPIGIKDCEKVVPNHKGFSHDYLYDEGLKIADKEYLCLLCFSFTHYERNDCYNALNKCKFITNIIDSGYAEEYLSGFVKKIPTWINFDFLHKSYYTLSPRGAGEDCHRFYEAIYLDSIPIVKRTNTHFDKLYDIFPCLIINNWEEVTEDLLIQNKDKYMNKIKEFKTKYPNAFTDINSIHELLLQT